MADELFVRRRFCFLLELPPQVRDQPRVQSNLQYTDAANVELSLRPDRWYRRCEVLRSCHEFRARNNCDARVHHRLPTQDPFGPSQKTAQLKLFLARLDWHE